MEPWATASRVIALEQGLALLPLTDAMFDALPKVPPTEGASRDLLRFLGPAVLAFLVARSVAGPLAYVETDYFGGEGEQGAAVAQEGRLVFGPTLGDGSINHALRLLGAAGHAGRDEFDAVGLGRRRGNDGWLDET